MARIEVAIAAAIDAAAGGHHRGHRRCRRVDLQDARRVGHRPRNIGAVAGRIADRCPVQVERGHRQVAGVLPGANRVAEGERIAVGAAAVVGSAAIVERQRRHPARNRHYLAHGDGERDHMARIEVAIAAAIDAAAGGHHRGHRRCRRVDLQDARRVGHRPRNIGAVAGRIADRCPVQVERGHRQVAGVLPGANRVAEGERIAVGAAAVVGSAAIVERQRRHPARNRHHLAHGDGERDHMARIEVAIAAAVDAAAGGHHRGHRRCRGVGRRRRRASEWQDNNLVHRHTRGVRAIVDDARCQGGESPRSHCIADWTRRKWLCKDLWIS